MEKIETYRKAIAAALAGLAPLVLHFWPGAVAVLGPEGIGLGSVVAATLAAWATENRLGGVNVNEWAAWALENLKGASGPAGGQAEGEAARSRVSPEDGPGYRYRDAPPRPK